MAPVNIDEIALPQEILDALKTSDRTVDLERLERIGKALESRKNEAVAYRQSSGIEETWAQCEDAYAGIDDMNRHEYRGNRWIKPTTMNAPMLTGDTRQGIIPVRSSAFVRLTTRYVDAGSAKIGEILLPIDDKAFSFSPTPVPDLINGQDDPTPVPNPDAPGETLKRQATSDEMQQMETPPDTAAPEVDLRTMDLVKEKMDLATAKAKRAETKIFDWQVECQHPFEMRKVIFDAARIGVGISKGPFPDKRRRMAMIDGQLVIKEDIVPIDKWVDPWNIFPDPACGEDIRNGDYLFERGYFSEKQVRELKGLPGYLDNQIDKVLFIGPAHTTEQTRNPTDQNTTKHPYVVWFYHGTMDREDFETINPSTSASLMDKKEQVHVVCTMINDLVVHGTVNPLERSGDLPYHAVPWIRKPNSWVGTGVAEQLFTPQRMANAATRSLLNNAGVSAGPQIVINQRGIQPANNDWNIVPNKIWYLTEAGQTDDIRKAFYSVDIHNVGDQLYKIVEYAMRLAEESSSIPLITQGLSGKTTPDTFGATQLQDNNANQLLRYIGYNFDGYVTVRQTNQYYEYLLLDPEIGDDHKGDFSIHAHGSVALVERAIQDQTIAQMTPLAQDPQFGVNPKKWFAMLARSKHLNPAEFQYSKEEQAKIDAMPKPQPPQIEVAKIRAATVEMQIKAAAAQAAQDAALEKELATLDAQITIQAAEMANETTRIKVKLDTDRDTVYAQTEVQRVQVEHNAKMMELQLKRELAIMESASKQQISVDQVKAKLADTALKLQTQKELAAMDAKLRVHEHITPSGDALRRPAVQLPGKAGQGKALSQL